MVRRARETVTLWDGRSWWCWGYIDGLPAFAYGWAPDGLATVSQLHAAGWQRRRGQDPYGVLTWRRGRRTANLWRVDEAVPRQPFTPRRRAALTLAYLAHFRCARGHECEHYVHPHYGLCTSCLEHAGLLETVDPAARTRIA